MEVLLMVLSRFAGAIGNKSIGVILLTREDRRAIWRKIVNQNVRVPSAVKAAIDFDSVPHEFYCLHRRLSPVVRSHAPIYCIHRANAKPSKTRAFCVARIELNFTLAALFLENRPKSSKEACFIVVFGIAILKRDFSLLKRN
jgi:hypothetical protein